MGGSVMLNEEAGRANYGQNQQREKQRKAGTSAMDIPAVGHEFQRDEPIVDEKLEKAVSKDLEKRNIKTPKPNDTEQ